MEDRSPESFELLALSYCHWRLMCALGIGFLACLWRFPRRQREAWLVAAAILLVAFLEVGLTLMAGRTMRFVGAIVPNLSAEQIAAWFNFLIKPLYSSLSMAAWGLIFYAAFGPGSGNPSKYLVEDERSKNETAREESSHRSNPRYLTRTVSSPNGTAGAVFLWSARRDRTRARACLGDELPSDETGLCAVRV